MASIPSEELPELKAVKALSWDDIRYFIAVSEAGSASKAALALGVRHSTIGKRISNLEGELGTRLFERKPGASLVLTKQGALIVDLARPMAEAAPKILSLKGYNDKTDFEVSILATEGIATFWLVPAMMQFRLQNPDIQIRWMTTTEMSGSKKSADILLSWQMPTESTLVGRRLGSVGPTVFTTPEYVERKGRPKSIEDLQDHDPLHVSGYEAFSPFEPWNNLMRRFKPSMLVDSPVAVEAAMDRPRLYRSTASLFEIDHSMGGRNRPVVGNSLGCLDSISRSSTAPYARKGRGRGDCQTIERRKGKLAARLTKTKPIESPKGNGMTETFVQSPVSPSHSSPESPKRHETAAPSV